MNGKKTETKMKRWQQQRWLLDAVVKTVGIEWDQARISSKARPAGIDALGEYHAVARRIRKFDDCAREFAIQAKRREYFGDERPIAPSPHHIKVAAERYGLGEWRLDATDLVRLGERDGALI